MIKYKKYLVSIISKLIPIFIYIIIVIILLYPLLFEKGIPFYGDEEYYRVNLDSYYFSLLNNFYMWITGYGASPSQLTLFAYSIPLTLLTYLFSQEIAVKIFILIVAFLPSIMTYFGFIILSREWNLFKNKLAYLFAALGGLFMLLNFYNAGLIGAATAPSWSYATFPLTFALFVKFLKRESLKSLLLFSVISLFSIANPFWLYLQIIAGFIYLLLEIATRKVKLQLLLKRVVIIVLVVVFIHSFWLLPIIVSYIRGAGSFFQVYTTQQVITFESLRSLSHWNLLDVMMVGERSYYFFWEHPQNYGPLNITIPILAVISILLFRKNKYIIFIALLLIIGIFLTKGVHEPGGYLYYLIAKNLPYGAGAILRNPTKFAPLVAFSYAFLISLTITKIYEKFDTYRFNKAILNTMKYIVLIGLSLLVLGPITYGTLLDLQHYTWIRYKPVEIPHVYYEINNWLKAQGNNFKVMWIPSGGGYIWKPYVITGFPDLLSYVPVINFQYIYPQPLANTSEIGEMLRILGVKYVIYHGDSIDYPVQEILDYLLRQKDLRIVYNITYVYVPEDNSKAPLPRGEANFVFSSSPFKLISPHVLARGKEVTLELEYTIPNEVVENGFSGKFGPGFNIFLSVYRAGYATLDERVQGVPAYDQIMLNQTSGYAYFKIKIPYNYPYTSVDIYANFYDCCYRPLTPSYYVARLPVVPNTVNISFIVFENEKYSGPIYATNAIALVYGLSFDELMKSGIVDTQKWVYIPYSHNIPSNILNITNLIIYNGSSLPKNLDILNDQKMGYISVLNLPKHLIDVNDKLILDFYIPRNGTYYLFIKSNGTFYINNTYISCNIPMNCFVKFTLKKGINYLIISSKNKTYIYSLILFNNNAFELLNENSTYVPRVLYYKEINPTLWEVAIDSTKPFVLVFTEPYDKNWKAYINGNNEVNSIPAYGLVNGFIVNKTGIIYIKIYYSIQMYYIIGMLISSTAFLIVVLFAIIPYSALMKIYNSIKYRILIKIFDYKS